MRNRTTGPFWLRGLTTVRAPHVWSSSCGMCFPLTGLRLGLAYTLWVVKVLPILPMAKSRGLAVLRGGIWLRKPTGLGARRTEFRSDMAKLMRCGTRPGTSHSQHLF